MNAKENALRNLHFDHPERITRGLPAYTLNYLESNGESSAGDGHESPQGTYWVDNWGTRWHKQLEGVMAFPCGFPLAELRSLKVYHWPDPNDERMCGQIYRMAKAFSGGDLFLAGDNTLTL